MRNSAINAYIYSGIFVVTYVFVYNYKPISEKYVNLDQFYIAAWIRNDCIKQVYLAQVLQWYRKYIALDRN